MTEISAKIIAHSRSAVNGKEIITFELIYPRFIHSEILTHRMFSRNSMSSRAVPIEKMVEQVRTDPAKPIHWGKNKSGMQAKEELVNLELKDVKAEWQIASDGAADSARYMSSLGAHKQIVNRILEPFQWMKTVVTATEFENFFWLRNHEDAQPEIKRLAEVMLEALSNSVAFELRPGDWHTPYYAEGAWIKSHSDTVGWFDYHGMSLEDALAISSSCCAQVSYRVLDDSLEKAKSIYARLVESEPVHASPFEHSATPMTYDDDSKYDVRFYEWAQGVTHQDSEGDFWSGNFKSWIQYRQLIPNNVKKG